MDKKEAGWEDGQIVRLAVSALLLLLAAAVKLAVPELFYSAARLVVGETSGAFLTLGRAVGEGESVADAAAELLSGQEVPVRAKEGLCAPVEGEVILGFGPYTAQDGAEYFHYGIDIAAAEGAEVRCAASGRVLAVGESSAYGHYVIVTHPDGLESVYARLAEVCVSDGQELAAGESLGRLGGEALYFELSREGEYLDPEELLCG